MKTTALAAGRAVLLGAAILASVAAGPSQCSNGDTRNQGYVALSPVAVIVPHEQLSAAADYFARLRPGSVVLKGEGVGMQPLYRPGTLVVVEPVPFDDLREGMTVVFRDADGFRFAHYLIALGADGWVTRGLGLKDDDPGPLKPGNYIGVIVMAFSPDQTIKR